MATDVKDVLARVDGAIAEWDRMRRRSKYDDCSDLPRDQVIEMITVLRVTLNRLAPRDSQYRVTADRHAKDYGENNPSLLTLLVGLLRALRRDYESGDLSAEDLAPPQGAARQPGKGLARDVFVVHGRNTKLRDQFYDFLRAIDLHPIEWAEAMEEARKPSAHIGEIVDAAFTRAGAVLVILSPDDEARLRKEFRAMNDPSHEKELTGQARPNVLFEAGMAFATHKDRTVLVQTGHTRPFSDVAGRYVIRFDGSPEKRKELAASLKAAGCPVNDSGTDWLSAGDFSPPALGARPPLPMYRIPRPR
jgi:predicted nucleotide-binding protein